MWRYSCLLGLVLGILCVTVQAQEPMTEIQLERTTRALAKQLHCVVCQGQSIYDSDASLAADMRLLIRERLNAGDSPAEILAYMESRYGTHVLLRTPMRPGTYLLWGSPFLFGGIALMLAWRVIYSKRRYEQGQPETMVILDTKEQAALDALRQVSIENEYSDCRPQSKRNTSL